MVVISQERSDSSIVNSDSTHRFFLHHHAERGSAAGFIPQCNEVTCPQCVLSVQESFTRSGLST